MGDDRHLALDRFDAEATDLRTTESSPSDGTEDEGDSQESPSDDSTAAVIQSVHTAEADGGERRPAR